MKKLKWAGVALAVLAPLGWWFFYESGAPTKTFPLDLAQLRALADSLPGEKPHAVRVEYVTAVEFPEIAVLAGASWASTSLPMYAYQLQYTDGTSVVLDSTMDRATADATSASFFDPEAFTRVLAAMEKATLVVVTHEHYDHLGGVAAHPKLEALAGTVIKLSKEQVADASKREPLLLSDAMAAKLATLSSDPLVAVAPGVVLIKMPGHTPGTLAAYVRRDDGTEYLFVSDVAWHEANWKQVRERARLVTQVFLGEDRDAVLAQLAAIKALSELEPKLLVVPGHDGVVMQRLLTSGALVSQFQ